MTTGKKTTKKGSSAKETPAPAKEKVPAKAAAAKDTKAAPPAREAKTAAPKKKAAPHVAPVSAPVAVPVAARALDDDDDDLAPRAAAAAAKKKAAAPPAKGKAPAPGAPAGIKKPALDDDVPDLDELDDNLEFGEEDLEDEEVGTPKRVAGAKVKAPVRRAGPAGAEAEDELGEEGEEADDLDDDEDDDEEAEGDGARAAAKGAPAAKGKPAGGAAPARRPAAPVEPEPTAVVPARRLTPEAKAKLNELLAKGVSLSDALRQAAQWETFVAPVRDLTAQPPDRMRPVHRAPRDRSGDHDEPGGGGGGGGGGGEFNDFSDDEAPTGSTGGDNLSD